ncbi:hypothetical protein VNO78_23104 [Psophocarpus tetragonolobus]|uniref:Uncharacterized protein n=1 Tax=Psophocarpus tetragonolobus TaxID=3891 RepID=A0AAN9XDB2_PSOTE
MQAIEGFYNHLRRTTLIVASFLSEASLFSLHLNIILPIAILSHDLYRCQDKIAIRKSLVSLQGMDIWTEWRVLTSIVICSDVDYQKGYTIEDATRLSLIGDIDVHSIFVASLTSPHHIQLCPIATS